MITFLPFPNFRRSAKSLDRSRLGKQRPETLILINANLDPKHRQRNHAAARMWRGYVPALCVYGLEICKEWCNRGYEDGTWLKIERILESLDPNVPHNYLHLVEFRPELIPPWLGDPKVHQSHRSRLIQKDWQFYRVLQGWDEPVMPYHWPEPHNYYPGQFPLLDS